MSSRKNLSFVIVLAISISFLVLIVFVATNLRQSGIKNAAQKSSIATELIETGLTTMMINGIMDNREDFLNRINKTKHIEELWLSRSPSVIKQHGKGLNNEIPKDEIDKQVISSGSPYQGVVETAAGAKLRFTVPYKATENGNPNCMACHEAKDGEVLGAISMVFDMTDMRNESFVTIFYMVLASLFIMLVVLFVINRALNPFMEIFESINNVMKHAKYGDYSKRVICSEHSGDGQKVTGWINEFLEDLGGTLGNIQKNIRNLFDTEPRYHTNHPLEKTDRIIEEVSQIYNLKRIIERDEDKATIYERLATILTDRFNLCNFQIIEAHKNTGQMIVYYSCQDKPNELPIDTRALRSSQNVFSTQFKNISPSCSAISEFYACLPYKINNDIDCLLYFICENAQEVENIKNLVPQINNFIDAIRPEIVNKNLNEVLKKSSITDQLTGLNNRTYLDEFIDKAASQALRKDVTFGILMIDIDFFKIVNDTYGHDVGDRAIVALSKTIKNSIRESDIAFRYGGEEFLVVLYGCDSENIFKLADKIRSNFEKVTIEANTRKTFQKTISIGCSAFPKDSTSIWSCIKYSDIALYKAKESGRNKVVIFNENMLDEQEKGTYKAQHDKK